MLQDMSAQDPATGIAALEALHRWGPARMEQALSQVMVPLGVIQSSAFRNASSLVEASLGSHASSRIVELEGTGHFLMSEDPARFNDALRAMVSELASVRQGQIFGASPW
jgi:pimeloyl-ACP methyl ester carboxylesterase